MSTIAALPPSLRSMIITLARRIRLLRALRGGSLLCSVLLLTASAAFVSDYYFGLPTVLRWMVLIAWAGLGSALAVLVLFLPLCRRLSPEALAALIEERYPDLGERLTSAIELASNPGKYHGSPALVAVLIDEAEMRTRRLNVLEAVPARPTVRLAATAAVLFFLAGSCAVLWPRPSLELGRRFLLPWRTPGALVFYSQQVAPGNITAAKGRPLTFSVVFTPEKENVSLPESSTLVMFDTDGTSSRWAMLAESSNGFHFRLDKVNGDFRYRVEAGEAVSDTYQVTAVEPVDLAADSPTITLAPPAYAKDRIEEQTIHGLADLTALQHSRVRFDFRFTRPARTAVLEWPSQVNDEKAPRESRTIHPLALTADSCGASCELPALTGGSYRLLLEGTHSIRTELEPRILTVKVDQPPAFLKVVIGDKLQPSAEQTVKGSAKENVRLALPYDSVPVDMALTDDIGVGRAEWEYRINDGASQWEPIPLQRVGSREAQGHSLFKLTGKGLHEGDTLRYRIRATDNREVPEAGLGPNTIYAPPDQWLTLTISDQAQPLLQQDILAQRDDLDRRLTEIRASLIREQQKVNQLRPKARQQQVLKEEQAKELKQLREQNEAVESALRDLGRVAAEIRPLQTLGDEARAIADQQVHRSDESLQRAEEVNRPQPRDYLLQNSHNELNTALRRIDEMRRANERLAQARQDLLQLDMLSDRQEQLAARAAEDSTREPANPDHSRELKHDQEQIANELQRLAEQSEPVRKALEEARAEQAQQLAARAHELAQAERELEQAAQETRQKDRQARRAELARQQQALAERMSQLAKATRPAARAAGSDPLQPADANRAADALREDNAGEALRLQQHNREELERLAKDLDQASERAREPREAARQLARLQESLRQELNEQASKERAQPGRTERLEPIRREQEALSRTAENLPIPAENRAARQQQREAVERATQALDALEGRDARHAEVRMAQAAQALKQLAEQLPAENPAQAQKQPPSTSERTARGQAPEPAPAPEGLPSHKQAEQARELAEQQRELSAAVQQFMRQEAQGNPDKGENPVTALTREQAEIVRQATEMARNLGQERGPQAAPSQQAQHAAQSAEQTLKQLQGGAIRRAYQAGTRTAGDFQQLARQLTPTPGGTSEGKVADVLPQARRLTERQEEVNRRLKELPANSEAQQVQQQTRQQQLQQQTSDLNQDLQQLDQQLAAAPLAQRSAQRAAEAGQDAYSAMQQARDSAEHGDQGRAQQAQRQAALALDQAARQAEMAAQQVAAALDLPHPGSEHADSGPQPGQELQQAQNEMHRAQVQLGERKEPAAREAMQRASQALKQAARQLAQQPGQPNDEAQPNGLGVSHGGRPGPIAPGSDTKQYAGKRWGELPGQLRTKIIQDVQARYGDDYARIIKLYFEQIADTNK